MMQFKALRDIVSASTGESVKAGAIISRDGFLAPATDDDVNMLVELGIIVMIVDEAPPVRGKAKKEVNDGTV